MPPASPLPPAASACISWLGLLLLGAAVASPLSGVRRGAGGAAHGASVRPGAEEHFEAHSQAPESLDAALCSHAPEEILSQPDGQDLVLRNEQQCWFGFTSSLRGLHWS